MNNKLAALLITQNDYLAEAKLIINKLNESDIKDYFNCYFACKNVDYEDKEINWSKINIDKNCKTWGSEILYSLNLINEEYVLIFLDDFYPIKKFSAQLLKKTIQNSLKYKPSLIRINSNYNRRILLQKREKNIFEESYLHKYSTSLVLPVFKKEFLKRIIFKKDSPWLFERYSNNRFNFKRHTFLFIKGREINFSVVNIVVRGELLRSSLFRIQNSKKLNYMQNTRKSKKPYLKEILFHLKKLFSDLFMRYMPYFKLN